MVGRWQGEVCDKCHRRNVVGFNVPDEVWERVTSADDWDILCATCFDELADQLDVRYQFVGIWPVSWSEWE